MSISDIFNGFTTQEQAIEYLEQIRWRGQPKCPYCGRNHIGRHTSGDRPSMRWQCHDCARTFSVTVGTIFQGTHTPLKKWFLLASLMVNPKKPRRGKRPPNASQIARDLDMRRATISRMMSKIGTAMESDPVQRDLLKRIVDSSK